MSVSKAAARRSGIGLAATLSVTAVLLTTQPAYAQGGGWGTDGGGGSDGGDGIDAWSQVVVTTTGGDSSAPPMTPVQGNWTPPPCWYEPRMSAEEMAEWGPGTWTHSESAQAEWIREWEEKDWNQDKDGAWWDVAYNKNMDDAFESCEILQGNPFWVDQGDVPEDGVSISPETLAEIAYNATRLPAPPVELKPDLALQKVNLPVHASFQSDTGLQRVATTASINLLGVQYAATTVATPKELRIDAGTEYAEPGSCTYGLSDGGAGGYDVNTEDAGCNVTYRKSSGEGTYPLEASLTWEVHWTASADPDGPPEQGDPQLPDGQSSGTYDVTVKEIQTVVR
ncbi:hypothetical protein O7599_07120 [Streptomyces sp. WMMC500]|uniref:hypothetical protein n=1 Tax=Streptomyces sp. WMMC500 TaxID=3015154 RepID=UPI00248C2E3D|nr:hypothetical protein [Streptomyces sp. WMMC500]WBB62294.1 hypothetical protein O7599_07120 [Streptomyces sp. WMMC500]